MELHPQPELTDTPNPTRSYFVAGPKYKRLPPGGPPIQDLYQVFAYANALGVDRAHLVYAAGGPERTYDVPRRRAVSGTVVHVHVADVGKAGPDLLSHVAAIGHRMMPSRLPATP